MTAEVLPASIDTTDRDYRLPGTRMGVARVAEAASKLCAMRTISMARQARHPFLGLRGWLQAALDQRNFIKDNELEHSAVTLS